MWEGVLFLSRKLFMTFSLEKKNLRLTLLALIAIAGYIYMSELKSQQNSVNTGTGTKLQ